MELVFEMLELIRFFFIECEIYFLFIRCSIYYLMVSVFNNVLVFICDFDVFLIV